MTTTNTDRQETQICTLRAVQRLNTQHSVTNIMESSDEYSNQYTISVQ